MPHEKPPLPEHVKKVSVVSSGEALAVAERLLGIQSSHVLADASSLEGDFFDKPRPAQLGLGAAFVSHKTAVNGLSKLASRIKHKGRSRQQRIDAFEAETSGREHKRTSAVDAGQVSSDSEDEREEGKAASFSRAGKTEGSGRKKQWSRQMLFSASNGAVQKKPRKKSKKGKLQEAQ